ncbi:MAG TPA: alpha/beta hydrolase [Permianibacter sp.]|nr:alpha/beta hydrolase [Permianibacter sp.]
MLLLCCLASCAAPRSTPNPTATVAPAARTMTTQLTELDGRQVEYWAHHVPDGKATLVFESGLMLPLSTWQAVTDAFTSCCNMLAYNRPGVELSAEAESATDPVQRVEQLRQLLQAQQLPPPYILVGHSLGGQYAQLFATRFPEQVSAMLLVDALPVGIVKPSDEFPWFTRFGLTLFAPGYVQREVDGIYPMGELVAAAAGSFDKPMIRIVAVADPPPPPPQGLIKDLLNGVLYASDFGVWLVEPDIGEQRMDVLYPHADVRRINAVHRIQESMPAVVVAAIQDLMEKMQIDALK